MHISIRQASGKSKCRNIGCERKETYVSSQGKIIKGTTCAVVSISSAQGYCSTYYCRDCIDKIYLMMKVALNPKLWIFK